MRISGSKKASRGGKRIRINEVQQAVGQGGVWCRLGLVTQFDNQTSHFELEGDDVRVDVKLVPDGEPCFCRLMAVAGGANHGLWAIPPVGTEVLVLFPEGTVEGEGIIVGMLSTGDVPDGVTQTTAVMVTRSGGQFHVHDGTDSQAVSLALKSDVESLRTTFNGHGHGGVTTGAGFTVGPSSVTPIALAGAPIGTTVLKAK